VRYVIRRTDDDPAHPYELIDPKGVVVKVDRNPEILARWAWGPGGANEVRHEYDGEKWEEEKWRR
jgi:hypothetical protein